MSSSWIVAIVFPFVVAWTAIAVLRRAGWTQRLEDRPNERSLHADPRRRVGGIGLLLGALPVMAWLGNPALHVFAGCAAALALISFLDDVRSLPIEVRLPAHLGAAGLAILALGSEQLGAVNAILAILFIAWMANLFNFMDGADGLAGGMAAIGFATLALAAVHSDALPLALACGALASASVAFLAHNFPPARAFLGDAGSIPLGFLAGILGVYGALERAWPLWLPVLVFSPFIVDATFTLARRALRREPVWRAHRSHLYQRLVLAGWSHRRLALWAYGLMIAVGVSALAAQRSGAMLQCGIIAVWAVAFALLPGAIGRFLRRAGRDPRG
jgi:UDP-GlcNAc:undecaprenyl-phosphate GlcNAc-1-phosphate transferase